MDFLRDKVNVYEAESAQSGYDVPVSNEQQTTKKTSTASTTSCPACQGQHKPIFCDAFKAASPTERLNLIKSSRRCINCMEPFHNASQCYSASCKKCNKRHHTLLHEDEIRPISSTKKEDKESVTVATTVTSAADKPPTLLGTANVFIKNKNGQPVKVRALLDPGSQLNILTEDCAKKLGLQLKPTDITVTGIGKNQRNGVQGEVCVEIQNRKGDFTNKGYAAVMDRITSDQPRQEVVGEIEVANGLDLADENYKEPGPIEVLLGVEVYVKACRRGLRHPKNGGPGAINTAFGWVLMGTIPKENRSGRLPREVASNTAILEYDEKYLSSSDSSDSSEDLLKLLEHRGYDKCVLHSYKEYVKRRKRERM